MTSDAILSLSLVSICSAAAGMLSMRLVMMPKLDSYRQDAEHLSKMYLSEVAHSIRQSAHVRQANNTITNLSTEISRLNNVAGKLHTVRDKTGRFKCKNDEHDPSSPADSDNFEYFLNGETTTKVEALTVTDYFHDQYLINKKLSEGVELSLAHIMAWKRPLIIKAWQEGLSARSCARVFEVSHEMAAESVRGLTREGDK